MALRRIGRSAITAMISGATRDRRTPLQARGGVLAGRRGTPDQHLTAIADAIHARIDLLETINSAKALAMLVGDCVRFNHHTRPQYLRGVEGVVIDLDQHTATVCVHQPLGRFRSGEIRRCPPLLLERLPPAA
jgi:hypothetical protein